jgi:hypothetical protein
MKTFLPLILSLVLVAPCAFAADDAAPAARPVLRHVVCFKFKAEATPDQIAGVERAFLALKDKIPAIAALEWGTNVSPEKHDKGFTHCFLLTFKTEADRDAYLPHPEHKAFGKLLGPLVADVFVVDYLARE